MKYCFNILILINNYLIKKSSFTDPGLSGIKDFRFMSYLGPLAHPVEHLTLNQRVAGSSPARPIF